MGYNFGFDSAPTGTYVPLSEVTTAGDLIVATGNAAVERLGKGSSGNVLTVGGPDPSGLEWSAPASGLPAGIFNVMSYGATGNGTTDDSAAIQSAINAAINATFSGIGGIVYFPFGKYYVATGLTCSVPGVTFEGQAQPGTSQNGAGTGLASGCTEIIVGDGQWGLTLGTTASANYRGYGIKNIQFFEKNSGLALGGVRLFRSGYGTFENVAWGEFNNSVATTFNGTPGALSTLATLTLTSVTGWPVGGGSGRILASDGWHGFIYTAVSGSTLTGCVYLGNSAQTVASSAAIQLDVGIGFFIDGRLANGTGGDAPYNRFVGCTIGKCITGFQEYSANGTRFVGCSGDGDNNVASSVVAGSIGVLVTDSDTFRWTAGSNIQGFDTLFDVPAHNGTVIDDSTRYEIWSTAAVILRPNHYSGSPQPSYIGGTGDNSLIGGTGIGVDILSGVVGATIGTALINCTTPVSDSGTGTLYIGTPRGATAVTVSSNAGTVPVPATGLGVYNFTNSSAATMAITLATTGAVDGQRQLVRVYDFSGTAETIGWTNTENSTVSAPTTSNGSTTNCLTVGFVFNGATSKWRVVAVA